MLTAAKPANKPKGTTAGAQNDDAYFEARGQDRGASETSSVTAVDSGPQDLEIIAREAGLNDAAVSLSKTIK